MRKMQPAWTPRENFEIATRNPFRDSMWSLKQVSKARENVKLFEQADPELPKQPQVVTRVVIKEVEKKVEKKYCKTVRCRFFCLY